VYYVCMSYSHRMTALECLNDKSLKTAASVENELPGFFFVINLQICTKQILNVFLTSVFFLILTRILNALITAYLSS